MVDPPYRVKNMMPGMIMLWHGTPDNVPSGWHLCDGTVGTPNLLNKFVPCAGDTYDPHEEGGADSQTHDFTGAGHVHGIPQEAGCPGAGPHPCLTTLDTDSEVAAGTTDASDNRPQYHALCYIM
ncbi:unnamed protein product, partial [marine sediment metagenome]